MEAYPFHVYVCNQQKPEGVPSCSAHGSNKLIDGLRAEIRQQGLGDTIQVTTCGSVGLCDRGPNMVVYPDGVWYSGVKPEDLPEIVREHFGSGRVVERLVNKDPGALRAEVDTNKKKMFAVLRANDAAGVLPDELMQRIRGFQASRVVLSAVELDVFTAIGHKADAGEVARRLGTDPRATEMFLNALVALHLLEKSNGLFSNTDVSARYLMEGSSDDSRASIMHSVHLWDRWSTLTACVRQGTSVSYKDPEDRSQDWTRSFIAAMHKNARARAPLVVKTIGVDGLRKVLDVGGGSGAYSIAFAEANAQVRVEVFDLPDVVALAQRHIDSAGVADRVKTRVGDFHTDEFETGYDLIFISAICHMNSPEENIRLFKKSFKALVPGGRVVVQDFILRPDKASPPTAALFALNMLVGTRAGSSYSEVEYSDWLSAAGFRDRQMIRLPGPTALVLGHRH